MCWADRQHEIEWKKMAKKKTAVNWLIEQIKNGIDFEDCSIDLNWLHDGVINQARSMEREQIEESWDSAYGGDNCHPGKQYFTETYETE